MRLGYVLGSLLLASTSACSYAFVRGPPSPTDGLPGTERPGPASLADCTTSNAAPIVDTILVLPLIGVGGVATLAAIDGTAGEWAPIAVGAFALGALAVASAATGYGRTAECRRLKEALPDSPHASQRYLLDVRGIAAARSTSTESAQ